MTNIVNRNNEDLQIRDIIEGFKQLTNRLDNMDIIEAKTRSGAYYSNDEKKHQKVLAVPGMSIVETDDTYQISLTKDIYNVKEAAKQLPGTQQVRGTVLRKDQSTISRYVNE